MAYRFGLRALGGRQKAPEKPTLEALSCLASARLLFFLQASSPQLAEPL
jgi:hypothetical protein